MISSCSEANLRHWKKYSRANKAIVALIKGSVQLLLLFSKGYRSSCSMQSTMMQQISLSFSHVRIYIYANDKVKWPEGKCKMCSNSSRRIYLTHISPCFETGSEQQLEQRWRTTRRRISLQFSGFVCSSARFNHPFSGSVWQLPFEGLQSDVAPFQL